MPSVGPPCLAIGCERTSYRRGYCSAHYQRMRKNGTLELQATPSLAERFWAKVDKDGPIPDYAPHLGPCWIWIASTDRKGYGQINIGGHNTKLARAHRLAYELAIGTCSELPLDHLCRVRRCVNPDHLEPVTNAVNTRRGTWSARTHCPQGHPYDEVNTRVRTTRWGGIKRDCKTCHRERRRKGVAA